VRPETRLAAERWFYGSCERQKGTRLHRLIICPWSWTLLPPACAHQKADSVNTTGAVFMDQWEVSFGCEPQAEPHKNTTCEVILQGKDF